MTNSDKIVIFGAGKIGRSLIGQLFGKGGFEVVFIDILESVIEALNDRGNYNVVIKGPQHKIISVQHVRGVIFTDEDRVIKEIADADLLAISVGSNVMGDMAPLIAKGLIKRFQICKENPIDIILAENLRNAANYFREKLLPLLPAGYPFEVLIGIVETSIGKMVPTMREKDLAEDILQVFAEPYNNLIVDGPAFKNPIPDIEGLVPKNNMKAWVDRKLFIHNLGHATTSYLSYIYDPSIIYISESLTEPELSRAVRETMYESANVLLNLYPEDFTIEDLTVHIDDLLSRFSNEYLGDTIFRIGCDLFRKLGVEDRFTGVIQHALDNGLAYDKILYAYVCGYHFRATDEQGKLFPGDAEFLAIAQKGIRDLLETVGGFSLEKDKQFFHKTERIERTIKNRLKRKSHGLK